MKTIKKFTVCIALLLSPVSLAQEEHRIYLKIDTKNAKPESAIHWSVSEHTAVLNSGVEGPFTFFVRVGDKIHWEAISLTDPEVAVVLEYLDYVSGPRIFTRNSISGKDKLEATVIRAGRENYKYELHFRIGGSDQLYSVISQIRVGD